VTVINVRAGTTKRYEIGPWRSLKVADVDGQPGQEITATNGRLITIVMSGGDGDHPLRLRDREPSGTSEDRFAIPEAEREDFSDSRTDWQSTAPPRLRSPSCQSALRIATALSFFRLRSISRRRPQGSRRWQRQRRERSSNLAWFAQTVGGGNGGPVVLVSGFWPTHTPLDREPRRSCASVGGRRPVREQNSRIHV